MRVGIFTDVYFPYISGVVTATNSLAKALENKGCEVFIVCINADNKKYERVGNIVKIPAMKAPFGLYGYYLKANYPVRAIKMIEDLKLDMIHTQTEAMIGIFGKNMGKKFHIPVVHTMHTSYEASVDYITKGHFKHLGNFGAKALVKIFLSKVIHFVITPGEKSYDLLKNKYKIKQEVEVIPSGIDLKYYKKKYTEEEINKKKKELGLEDSFILLWTGRLGYEKNIEFLIKNHNKIIAKNKKCRLLVIGTGPEEEKLKKMVKEQNMTNYVVFTGGIPNKDIGIYYALSDVFVSASIYETQGLTLIEAMAAGVPVVCIDDISFRKVVVNKKNGLLFADEKEYVRAITYLIKNKELLESMKKNALKTSEEYSLEKFGEKVLKFYQKAIEYQSRNA